MPTIHDLPNELLLETFSYLDYSDLQNCLQATKILRAIAFHPALDHKLFRSKAVKHKHDTIDIDTLIVHPIFDRIFFTNEALLPYWDAYVSRCTNEFLHTGIPVIQNSVYKDNVTSPPVSCIKLSGRFLDCSKFAGHFLDNKNKGAITVGQVFEKLVRHYIEKQKESGLNWRESHAYEFDVNRTNSRSTLREGTNKHVKLECKDAVIVFRALTASREYLIRTRSNGAAFFGAKR
jgi:hypothetical protein